MNSRSEYSRCRVPRLRIDMEGWQKKTKEVSTIVQERVVETVAMGQEDGKHVDGLEEIETTSRRLDSNRKGEETKGRRAKKRKFPRLEGWGEVEDDTNHGESLADWLEEPERVERVAESRLDKPVTMDRIEMETLSMLQKSSKLTEKKLTISAEESGRTNLCSTPRGS